MVKGFNYKVQVHLYYIFSYTTLLLLRYGDRARRTHAAWDFVEENNTSIWEDEHLIDIGLFLDKYPRWELGTPHRAIILHEMFLHTVDRGWKEAEQMVCWAAAAVYTTLVLKQTNLPMEIAGTIHPKGRWETFTKVSTCWEGPQVFPLVALSQEEQWSKTYFLLWRTYFVDVDISPPLETWGPRKGKWWSSQGSLPKGFGHHWSS